MSKTRDTGFLGNVIKVDTNGNVSFVSGSTTLATLNTSGQLSGSSPVLSSSYALNADLLDGLDSTQFTLTSSFAAQTASFTAFTASVNSFTASQLVLNGTYATTGSNTFAGIQTINSNLVVTGSITAQTLVVQTITSSVDFVTGSTRFGSLSSNTHVFTGSMFVTGAFYVTTGSVGLGTSIPNGKLMLYSPYGGGDLFQNIISSTGGSTKVGINFSPAALENYPSLYPAQASIYAVDDNYSAYIVFATKVSGAVANSLTERVCITAAGNVGIGISNPDIYSFGGSLLTLSSPTTYSNIIIASSGSNSSGLQLGNQTIRRSSIEAINGSHLTFLTNNTNSGTSVTERMRINATGSVGIGASNITGKLMLYQSTAGNIFTTIASNQGNSTRAGINLNPAMNESDIATYEAQSAIYSTDYNYSARMNFATKAPGGYANSLTTRMLIFEGGNISIGGSFATSYTDTTLSVTGAGTTSATYAFIVKNSTPSDLFIVRNDGNVGIGINPGCKLDISGGYMALNDYALRWRFASDANHATVFTATYNGPIMYGYSGAALGYQGIGVIWTSTTGAYNYNNSTTWQQTSDIRIKQNLRPITGALSKICSLNPTHFEYKNKPGKTKTGFIAQEFEQVFEGHVTETDPLPEHQEYFEEGEKIKSIDADLIPYLVKAIQEQQAQINELKAQING